MEKIKSGKDEIIYLLSRAIEKYKSETGLEIVQNTNRKNYEGLAVVLSDISNQFPYTSDTLGTESYPPDPHQQGGRYPHRKYDITGGQVKDALAGVVSHPRSFLIDACYVYLYNMGRKAFEKNPVDDNLVERAGEEKPLSVPPPADEDALLQERFNALGKRSGGWKKSRDTFMVLSVVLAVLLAAMLFVFVRNERGWQAIKTDMSIMPYQPTQAEIDSLEGIWLCYTGSPQARMSDPARFHKVVPNLVEIKYKGGYFTFNRYGASFDHVGYMQFEAPYIVSVYSRVKSDSQLVKSPRHSLLNLATGKKYLHAISASWSFDVGENNKIIGIREVYVKLGKGGTIEEMINEIENASCQCKIIRWHEPGNKSRTFYLKNVLLDSLGLPELQALINEKSILMSDPEDASIIRSEGNNK